MKFISRKSQVSTLTNLLFFSYLFLAIILFSIQGMTFIPKLVGAALFGVFILEVVFKDMKIIFPYPIIGFLLFILVCLNTALLHPNSMYIFFTMLQILVFLFLVTNIVAKSANLNFVIWGLTFGLCYIIGNQLLQGRTFLDFALEARVETEIGDQNDYAFILTMCTNLILFQLILKKRNLITWAMSIFLASIFTIENLIASGSKAGIIYLLISLVYFIYFSLKTAKKSTKVFLATLTGFGVYGLYNVFISSAHFARIVNMFLFFQNTKTKEFGRSVDTSSQERLDLLLQAIEFWKQKPIFGWGFDQFRFIKRGRVAFSHNNYLELLCNHGVIGFLVFYSIYIYIIWVFYKVYKLSNQAPEVIWISSLILIMLVRDLVYVTYYDKLHFLLLSIVLGMIFFMKKKYVTSSKLIVA